MGFRFRRRVRILPGLWFNLSKTGGSVSIGGRGATLNLGPRGTRTTVGLPGSGLSYRSATRPWGNLPQGTPRPTGTHAGPVDRAPSNPSHGPPSDAPAGHRLLFWLGIAATIAAGAYYLSH